MRVLSFILIILILLILVILGIFLFFYINFIIGNNVAVKLDVDKRDLQIQRDNPEDVTFAMSGIANPLCKINCESTFFDVSNEKIIETETFELKPQISMKKSFTISETKFGRGQKLYRFGITCHNVNEFACPTEGKLATRSILITVEYDLNESDKQTIESLKGELESDAKIFGEINSSLDYFDLEYNRINKTIEIKDYKTSINKIQKEISEIRNDFDNAQYFWERQDYSALKEKTIILKNKIDILQKNFIYLNESIYSNIFFYNALVENLTKFKQSLEDLKKLEFNQTDASEINEIIKKFNAETYLFGVKKDIYEKENITKNLIKIDIQKFYNRNYNTDVAKYPVTENLVFNIEKIMLVGINNTFINLFFKDPIPECCVFKNCAPCCYGCDKKIYPIIFLHGHDFSRYVSAEYSLNAFDNLQKKLEGDGYLSAGEISLYTPKRDEPGLLGLGGVPISVRASYYFDVFRSSGTYISVQTKSENIDTYSIRLRELIDNVKYETNQSKVILVGHSMGGLVARRYIQIFGGENIDKLILVGTPNKGITGKIKGFCSIIGANRECKDLYSDSLFINKLNNDETNNVPTHNIIGTGCKMDVGDGDGIVLKENAFLDSANNYFIEGSCSGTNLLHGEMLDIEKYPKMYDIIKGILNQSEEIG